MLIASCCSLFGNFVVQSPFCLSRVPSNRICFDRILNFLSQTHIFSLEKTVVRFESHSLPKDMSEFFNPGNTCPFFVLLGSFLNGMVHFLYECNVLPFGSFTKITLMSCFGSYDLAMFCSI